MTMPMMVSTTRTAKVSSMSSVLVVVPPVLVSPPVEVPPGSTGVLLDTCFRQTEYAGVIAGTEHPAEARQLVDFLFSTVVQNDIPENMYVFPVNAQAELPETWAEYAEIATNPFEIDPAEIDANRERWIDEWAAIATP